MTEREQEHTYELAQVERAIVHSREDITLIVSLLDSVNLQLNWITRLIVINVIVIIIVAVLFFYVLTGGRPLR